MALSRTRPPLRGDSLRRGRGRDRDPLLHRRLRIPQRTRDPGPEHAELPGVAGFKINYPLNRPDRWDEVAAFLGASYFRALGQGSAYGLSARGLALNTGTSTPEEFPRFSNFYLARDPAGGSTITIYATLEGPSVTGAFRIVTRPGVATEMDVTARLFFRAEVTELGVAPLTSMFLFSEKNRAEFDDYRPNVHDSDGLRIVRADGDVIWRPLNNPAQLATSYFSETAPAPLACTNATAISTAIRTLVHATNAAPRRT